MASREFSGAGTCCRVEMVVTNDQLHWRRKTKIRWKEEWWWVPNTKTSAAGNFQESFARYGWWWRFRGHGFVEINHSQNHWRPIFDRTYGTTSPRFTIVHYSTILLCLAQIFGPPQLRMESARNFSICSWWLALCRPSPIMIPSTRNVDVCFPIRAGCNTNVHLKSAPIAELGVIKIYLFCDRKEEIICRSARHFGVHFQPEALYTRKLHTIILNSNVEYALEYAMVLNVL